MQKWTTPNLTKRYGHFAFKTVPHPFYILHIHSFKEIIIDHNNKRRESNVFARVHLCRVARAIMCMVEVIAHHQRAIIIMLLVINKALLGVPCSLLPSHFHPLLPAPMHFSILAPFYVFSATFHFSLLHAPF